jgi:hypothetical protein
MTNEEKLDWLRHEDQSTRKAIQALSSQVESAFQRLEKRVAALEAAKK